MIPKLEFGQLYKFVVSLGLVLMAIAVIGPWAILRDQGALLVTREALDDLTPRAQEVLELKQHHAELIVRAYPVVALVLLVTGAVVAVWGLTQWWGRQKVADERENVDLAVQKRTLEPQTAAEQESRLDADVEEAMAASAPAETEPRGRAGNEAPGTVPRTDETDSARVSSGTPTPARPAASENTAGSDYLAFRKKVRSVEALVSSRVAEALGGTHRIDTDVKVRVGEDVRGYADIVALAETDAAAWSLVIDVKFTRKPTKNIGPILNDSLLNGASVARALNRERSAALTVVVVEDGVDDERARRALARALQRIRDLSIVPVGALLISETELQELPPAQLRRRLAQAVIGLPSDSPLDS